MREQVALYRALGREQLPVGLLGFAIAIGLTWWNAPEPTPSAWLALALMPVALQAGLVAGRSSTRSLLFWLARPGARTQVLHARIRVAATIVASAWFLTVVPILLADPHQETLQAAASGAAVLGLGFVAGLVASALTNREPLAFGVATLFVSVTLLVPLLACQALEITPVRVLAAALPLSFAGAVICVGGSTSAVFRSWRCRLPLRDATNAREIAVRCGGAWILAELLWGAASWYAAAPERGIPAVVLGADDRGLLVALGSHGSIDGRSTPRIDAVVAIGETAAVVFDATARNARRFDGSAFEVSAAQLAGGRLVVGLSTEAMPRGWHRLVVVESADASTRSFDSVGAFSLSPGGAILAFESRPAHTGLVEIDSGESVTTPLGRPIGWVGDERLVSSWRGALWLGQRRIADLPPYRRRSVVSPDQRYLAVQRTRVESALLRIDTERELPARFDVIDLETTVVREYACDVLRPGLVAWLDREHFAFTAKALDDHVERLYVMDAFSGDTEALVEVPFGLRVTHIEGPLDGPWLVARSGQVLQAWAADAEVLWQEQVATLADDGPDARRWAVHEGVVVGIDPRGRWWRHPLPWEEES